MSVPPAWKPEVCLATRRKGPAGVQEAQMYK